MKPVICMETGFVFDSVKDVAQQMFELERDNGSISYVCKGKLKSFRGFTFEYV